MDWKKLLSEIIDAGMTQVEIASKCECAQSTISDLYRGETISPNFELGQKLVSLHTSRVTSGKFGRRKEDKQGKVP